MSLHEKLPKLIERMQRLVNYLDARNELTIHRHVDQSFYMQKIEELKTLYTQLEEFRKKIDVLNSHIDNHYKLCFAQWSKDVRLLNTEPFRDRPKSIL